MPGVRLFNPLVHFQPFLDRHFHFLPFPRLARDTRGGRSAPCLPGSTFPAFAGMVVTILLCVPPIREIFIRPVALCDHIQNVTVVCDRVPNRTPRNRHKVFVPFHFRPPFLRGYTAPLGLFFQQTAVTLAILIIFPSTLRTICQLSSSR